MECDKFMPGESSQSTLQMAVKLNFTIQCNKVLAALLNQDRDTAQGALHEAFNLARHGHEEELFARSKFWEGILFATFDQPKNACRSLLESCRGLDVSSFEFKEIMKYFAQKAKCIYSIIDMDMLEEERRDMEKLLNSEGVVRPAIALLESKYPSSRHLEWLQASHQGSSTSTESWRSSGNKERLHMRSLTSECDLAEPPQIGSADYSLTVLRVPSNESATAVAATSGSEDSDTPSIDSDLFKRLLDDAGTFQCEPENECDAVDEVVNQQKNYIRRAKKEVAKVHYREETKYPGEGERSKVPCLEPYRQSLISNIPLQYRSDTSKYQREDNSRQSACTSLPIRHGRVSQPGSMASRRVNIPTSFNLQTAKDSRHTRQYSVESVPQKMVTSAFGVNGSQFLKSTP